ncbi:hypothetical protein [Nonomuraea jabiensis]|uniref:hypothetical protein n=1 Tax=Nonomuraea jabiensis TaxID=882448 RepID=UPI0036BBF537
MPSVTVAPLHHMDAAIGPARMRDLPRPGGVLAVVGLARSTMPNDLPRDLAGVAVGTFHRVMKPHWRHPSPTVWPPPETYARMRALAARPRHADTAGHWGLSPTNQP